MENIRKEVCEPAISYITESGNNGIHIMPKTNRRENTPTPYSIEEIHKMIAEGEKQFASGQWQDSEEMFRELEETLAQEKH